MQQQNECLRMTLEKFRKANLKLKLAKCRLAVSSVTYIEDKLSASGVHLIPVKVAALKDMPILQCRNDLQRYLGMVNFPGKFPACALKQGTLSCLSHLWTEM